MRLLASLTGLLVGVAAALVFLLNNPLQSPRVSLAGVENVFDWRALEFHGAVFDPARLMNVPLNKHGEPFVADGIADSNVSLMLLGDKNGRPAALATRITYQNDKADVLYSDVGVSTYTNIIWPNYGSLFLHSDENRWDLIRNDAMQALGESNYQPVNSFLVSTPARDRAVAGGSGGFAGVGGRYAEELIADPAIPGRYAGRIALELQAGGN